MGILIGLEQISHEWPGKLVFDKQTIGIFEGDRIGIVGKNGDGKSTLLRLLNEEITPDSGSITRRSNIRVGMLGQNDNLADDDTVLRAIVGDRPEYEWASDGKTRAIMDALLGGIDRMQLVSSLSGGQRRRVDLVRLLIDDWDVLLLDEPTNHLDMQAIRWLADHIKRRWSSDSGAILTVTHDRWFLDEIATGMWEVHDGVIDPFEGGYSAYIHKRAERARVASVLEARRQSILRKELAWLARGPKARTSKSKFRIDEAKALIADEPPVRNPLELKRMAVSRLGKQVIEMKDVTFAWDDKPIANHIDWLIGPGDRYAILGDNGAGKSTLLSLMQKNIDPDSGFIKVGKSVKFGILSQRLDALEDKATWRVRELLAECKSFYVVDGKEQTPAQLLERLGFDKSEYDSVIQDLSGGQKRRLAIMYVLLQEPNVLILDEPGNDLDTDMLAVLEDVLDGWPGTLLIVSHDRYLVERVSDEQYALVDGKIVHLPGGVDEFLTMPRRSASSNMAPSSKDTSGNSTETAEPQLSNKERVRLKKRYDSITLKLKKLESVPGEIKDKMQQADPSDFQKLCDLQAELDQAKLEISELEDEWLELSETLGLD